MDALKIIEKYFKIKERDIGSFSRVKAKKYVYNIKCYNLEGFGNLCIMDEPGIFGLVHIYTIVITPIDVDAPIYMCENMQIPWRNMLIAELFDSQLQERMHYQELEDIKAKHPNLRTFVPTIYWAKKYTYDENYYVAVLRKQKEEVNIAWAEYLEEYCKILKSSPKCDPFFKKMRDDLYIEDLLLNGGPQRDHLLKAYDIRFISKLYREIIFGTEAKD